MKKRLLWAIAAAALTIPFGMHRLTSQAAPEQEHVGPLPDGGFLLNSGWTLRPVGEQVPVDTFPMSTAVSRNGKFLLVMNAGYNPPSISVIDIAHQKEVSRFRIADAFLGLTMSPVADKVYVGGGATGKVFELNVDPNTGALSDSRVFDVAAKGAMIGDVAVTYDAHILYATDLYTDQIAVVNLETGALISMFKTGKRPYKLLLPPGGEHLLVTAWGEGSIYEHSATSGELIRKVRVGPHPTDMVWLNRASPTEDGGASTFIARLFVTASNTNNAYSFGESGDGQFTQLETINLSLTPLQPVGMTPTALSLNANGTRLYAVCSDGNTVAAVDITARVSRVLGFIPTGWYPTAVRVSADGDLMILNGKGLGSHPNPHGPNPSIRPAPVHQGTEAPPQIQYVGHIQTGTVQFVPEPTPNKLLELTDTVRKNSAYDDSLIYGPPDSQKTAFFEKTDTHPSPIRHVIYVIKENRTYDQVLGDISKGNGDAALNLFGEKYTPNLHKLAETYILYDNFYENADVSAEGHNWANAAIAPDYTVKLWPSEYGHRSKIYDFEGTESANTPPAGYLWNNAMQAGVSVRDYGEWTQNFPIKQVVGGMQIEKVNDASLKPYVDMKYRGWDLDYLDSEREKEFAREWKQFDTDGNAPAISIVRMGNDHTKGMSPGALTPFAYNADNDYGVGLLVDTVSHSKLWATTAIFVIEDDSQNGPDHVDSHRAPVYVISPYTKRAIVDSTMYNQTSVLRTMELIVGLRPMTQFDAAAHPMFNTFSDTADTTPYDAIAPKVSLTDRNPGHTPEAAESAKMNFREADLVDDDDLTAVLWHGIKHTNPPPPTSSVFGR
jgi:DNA-binding beta-propeller fold protein YncE